MPTEESCKHPAVKTVEHHGNVCLQIDKDNDYFLVSSLYPQKLMSGVSKTRIDIRIRAQLPLHIGVDEYVESSEEDRLGVSVTRSCPNLNRADRPV